MSSLGLTPASSNTWATSACPHCMTAAKRKVTSPFRHDDALRYRDRLKVPTPDRSVSQCSFIVYNHSAAVCLHECWTPCLLCKLWVADSTRHHATLTSAARDRGVEPTLVGWTGSAPALSNTWASLTCPTCMTAAKREVASAIRHDDALRYRDRSRCSHQTEVFHNVA